MRVAVGLGLATISVPMMVPPPGLFSTITGWPNRTDSSLGDDARAGVGRAARRIGHDETHGPVGKGLRAAALRQRDEAGRAAAPPSKRRRFMVSSLPGFSSFAQPCHAVRSSANGKRGREPYKRGAGRSRAGGQQRRCGGHRRARFPARRMAGLRQATGRVHRPPPTRKSVRAAAGDGGQPHAVDEFRRRPCARRKRYLARAKAMRQGRQPARAGLDRGDRGLGGRRNRPQPGDPRGHGRPNGRAIFWPASSASSMPSTAATPRRCCASASACSRPTGTTATSTPCMRSGWRSAIASTRPRPRARQALAMRPPRSLGAPRHRPLPGGARQDARGRGLPANRCPTPGRAATPSCTPTIGGISRCS